MDKEQQIIRKYFYPLANNEESLELKNDAAFLKKNKLVISSDMMIEDQHFTKDNDPEILARKLLRINISDLAAMGATPYGFFLNIALPKKDAMNWIGRFSKGLCSDMQNFEIKLFGGDLSQSSKIFLSMTVLGKIKKHTCLPSFNLSSHQSVLVWPEQGIGDQILFSRFFMNLHNAGIKVYSSVDKKLLPLFKSSFPFINFVLSGDNLKTQSQSSIGGLGKFFVNGKEDLNKNSSAYLKVNKDRSSYIKSQLPKGKKICGLSWLSKNDDLGEYKSLSLEQVNNKIFAIINDELYSNLRNDLRIGVN